MNSAKFTFDKLDVKKAQQPESNDSKTVLNQNDFDVGMVDKKVNLQLTNEGLDKFKKGAGKYMAEFYIIVYNLVLAGYATNSEGETATSIYDKQLLHGATTADDTPINWEYDNSFKIDIVFNVN